MSAFHLKKLIYMLEVHQHKCPARQTPVIGSQWLREFGISLKTSSGNLPASIFRPKKNIPCVFNMAHGKYTAMQIAACTGLLPR